MCTDSEYEDSEFIEDILQEYKIWPHTVRRKFERQGESFCRGQIIYFNQARWHAENFKFYYMFIWNSS